MDIVPIFKAAADFFVQMGNNAPPAFSHISLTLSRSAARRNEK